MDETEFWTLIERSREDGADEQEEALERLLTGRPREELEAFDRIYREQLVRAYRWDLWGAGYVIAGGMSDDSFDYFCDWLISRGREVFEQALADPDSLADVPDIAEDEVEAEGLRYAVLEAFESTHGEELQNAGPDHGADPAGEEWDEDDLDELYPRLTAKFG
jgi:vacuolar-type H+-ATPase subunit C/Vma6